MTIAHRYEIFINAPRERVWEALVAPEFTEQYFFGVAFHTSWEPGVRYVQRVAASGADAVDGVIEVCEPPTRLVYTWHVLYDAAMAEEPPSRVEFLLRDANDDATATRVTLVHGDLAFSPLTWEHVRLGWVVVLDSLKSLLETGAPMPAVSTADAPGEAPASGDGAWHRRQGVEANNAAHEFLDGRELTAEQRDLQLARAHAAAYHWAAADAAGPINQARAAYMLARSYAAIGEGALALHYAHRCGEWIDVAGDAAKDWDVAYYLEALARAMACAGDFAAARHVYAKALASAVADPEDRAVVEADRAVGPWYSLASLAGTDR